MSCEIIVFTHNDYSDIWPIVLKNLKKVPDHISIHIATNDQTDEALLSPYPLYRYDDRKPYASRLVEVCSQVQSDYIFFFHDVDILQSFDDERFTRLMSWIIRKDIDRFFMGVFPTYRTEGYVGDMPVGLSGKNICDWFTTPYDVGPSIWKRDTFLELMTKHSKETYRSIESSAIQDDLLEKKVYGFCKQDLPIQFTIGRPYTLWFSFCHILVRGKWVPPSAYQSYADFFKGIQDEFKINFQMRGFTEYYHGMETGFTIS